ncbi:putative RND superfamily exporter protein [Alkalibacillus filiformis]|uniref:RND superfamily exporter protein n=1 Tax=Alkalibacillus filiformis TaxID=200990 RepID=A0ABU0DSD5_9BACI|nr:MMPL family transporter [Alkalibacillus filiformis]MDQ0351368.1 putative RND superfamily exporter protein [Alkalibacillus filiformis]
MKSLIARLLIRKPVKSVFITLLIMALLLTGVQFIEMKTGNDTLVEPHTAVYKNNEMLNEEFGGESVIVLFKAEDSKSLLSVDTFEIMEMMTTFSKEQENTIHSVISPYTLLESIQEQQRRSKELGLGEMKEELLDLSGKLKSDNIQASRSLNEMSNQISIFTSQGDAYYHRVPKEQETLNKFLYEQNGKGELRHGFADMIKDDRYTSMTITFRGGISDSDKSDFIEGLSESYNERNYPNLNITISGKPVLDDDIRQSMQESIQQMLALSTALMVLVLFIVFPVSWRLLPLATIFIALLGTVGLMGWLGVPITMVSMAVFPILIGLGIDYAIQFQNRYTEELRRDVESHE